MQMADTLTDVMYNR